MEPKPQLDHIVLHLPYSDLQELPSWLTELFTIAPGGRHGDGLTENKLILFADGTYIELIAFTSDAAREGHWWGDKGYGIIDYAFTLAEGAESFKQLAKRWKDIAVPAEWKPMALRRGSRKRPDGQVIEWEVAFPHAKARGTSPFYCVDVTPRERRVPSDSKWIEHPCGATGIAELILFTEDGIRKEQLTKMLDAALPQDDMEKPDDSSWAVGTPRKLSRTMSCSISLMPGAGEHEKHALRNGRQCVARLLLFTNGKDESLARNLVRYIGGDQLALGFVTVD